MLERFIQIHLFLARHRLMVLTLVMAFFIGAVLAGTRLKLNQDFTDVLPMSAPEIAEQVKALKHIQQADRTFIDVTTTTGARKYLTAAASQMAAALRKIPHLTDVRGKVDVAKLGLAYGELQDELPVMLTADELQKLAPKLTANALTRRLAWLKKEMMMPQGMMFQTVAQNDPAGISDLVSQRLRALRAGTGDARIAGGFITSADGRHILIQATPDFPSTDTGRSAPLVAAVLSAAHQVEQAFPAGTVKIAITGAHRSALENSEMIRRDSERTSIIATIAIALLIIITCRRRWLSLMALIPVAFGAAGGVAIFWFTGDLVSSVALGCGSMLIGITVDYGIYTLYTLDNSPPATRRDLAQTIGGLFPALIFGALTTMAAFMVMFLSPVSGHRQLGLFGFTGVALAALFALFVLPVFIPVESAPVTRPLLLTRLLGRLFDWRARNARWVHPLLLLFTLVCGVGLTRLTFDGDMARLNGVSQNTRQDEAEVRQAWGKALSLTTVVVGGATREETLERNERVAAVLKKLRAENVIESFSSVASLQPSAQTRERNFKAWRAFWTAKRKSQLRDSLQAAANKLGFRLEAFTPFLNKINATETAPPVRKHSALDDLTADFWSKSDGKTFVASLVKVPGTKAFNQLRKAVKQAVPGAMLLNKKALSDEITLIARRALPIFSLLVAALNGFLIYTLLGRIQLMLATLLPMAAGLIWTLGTLGLCGMPINIANFIFVIFIVGVGGDYALFMVLSELEVLRGHPERTAATGGAVTMCAFTSLLGTGVLVLAHHPALFSVGLTALLGISYCLLATLFLVPVSIQWLVKRNTTIPAIHNPSRAQIRQTVSRLYHFQGAYITHFAYWKMRTDPLFGTMEQAVPAHGEILDIGCGYGMAAHWLTLFNSNRKVHGVDFDPKKIRAAKATARFNSRVTFEQLDILEDAAFPACDCALLCDVLHYFPREIKADILRKVFAALRPGGQLVLRDAMAQEDSAHRNVARSEKWAVRLGQNRTRHGLHFEDEETHLTLLREAGFGKVKIQPESGRGSNALLVATRT